MTKDLILGGGNVSDLKKHVVRKRWVQDIFRQMEEKDNLAHDVAVELAEIMIADIHEGIRRLPEYLVKVREKGYGKDKSFVEAVAGGPCPFWTGWILAVVGYMYPVIDRELQEIALQNCLNFLDGLNYFNSQQNVELIREPWLVRDIIVSRSLYWPGFKRQVEILEKNRNLAEFIRVLAHDRNGIWMALAVIRAEWATLPVRRWYYANFPNAVDRTLDAIAAFTFNHAEHDRAEKSIPLEESIAEHLKKYDLSFHDAIRKKIGEGRWIKLK